MFRTVLIIISAIAIVVINGEIDNISLCKQEPLTGTVSI